MENYNNTSSPVANGDKHLDQLIIKAQLDDDIRKMMIHNEDLTLNELVLMMQRIFAGKISNSDELTIKYLDNDGDKITLSNDSDLTVALHFHKVLRLFLLINGKESNSSKVENQVKQQGDFIDEKTFRNELQDIRTTVQMILDRLKLSSNENSSADTNQEQQQQQNGVHTETNNQLQSNYEQPSAIVQTPETPTSSAFIQPGYTQEQQAKANIFGPPPTTAVPTPYANMPPVPTATAPRFPPAASTPPVASPPPQQGGFYGQQQNFYQPRPQTANNPYPPQPGTVPASNAPFVPQSPPSYAGYPPQNSYYNPVQQYPK